MEKGSLIQTKSFGVWKSFTVAILLGFLGLCSGCNSDKKDDNKPASDGNTFLKPETVTVSETSDTTKRIGLNSFYFTDAQQKQIFNKDNKVKQVVFRFKQLAGGKWGLSAIGTNDRGQDIGTEITLTPNINQSFSFPAGSKTREQVFTRGDFKELFGLRSRGSDVLIKEAEHKPLLLTPDIHPDVSLNDVIIFYVTKISITTKKKGDVTTTISVLNGMGTQPSPPADKTCQGSCDN